MTDNLSISTPFWFHNPHLIKIKKNSFNLISIFGFLRGLLLDRLKNFSIKKLCPIFVWSDFCLFLKALRYNNFLWVCWMTFSKLDTTNQETFSNFFLLIICSKNWNDLSLFKLFVLLISEVLQNLSLSPYFFSKSQKLFFITESQQNFQNFIK